MATNHTTHYQLNQWEAADQVLRTDFNQDNQKIDAALAGLDGRTEVLESAVSRCGNCIVVHGSDIGNGQAGVGTPAH